MDDILRPLKNQLMELKLKHLAAQLDDFMLTASCSDKPYVEMLQDFLAVEILKRRSVSMDKRLRMANLPTFDTPLDLETLRGLIKQLGYGAWLLHEPELLALVAQYNARLDAPEVLIGERRDASFSVPPHAPHGQNPKLAPCIRA